MTTGSTMNRITAGVDFYTFIHKSFRSRLFGASEAAGRTDWTNAVEAEETRRGISQLFSDLKDHAEHETRFWHPFIAEVNTDALRSLDSEHALQEIQIEEMRRLLDAAAAGDLDAGREFYRAFNAFLGDFLLHLSEEEAGNPLLWAVYREQELGDAYHAFKMTIPMEESLRYMQSMLPAMNPQDRAELFAALEGAPAETLNALSDLAARVLGSAPLPAGTAA